MKAGGKSGISNTSRNNGCHASELIHTTYVEIDSYVAGDPLGRNYSEYESLFSETGYE